MYNGLNICLFGPQWFQEQCCLYGRVVKTFAVETPQDGPMVELWKTSKTHSTLVHGV